MEDVGLKKVTTRNVQKIVQFSLLGRLASRSGPQACRYTRIEPAHASINGHWVRTITALGYEPSWYWGANHHDIGVLFIMASTFGSHAEDRFYSPLGPISVGCYLNTYTYSAIYNAIYKAIYYTYSAIYLVLFSEVPHNENAL